MLNAWYFQSKQKFSRLQCFTNSASGTPAEMSVLICKPIQNLLSLLKKHSFVQTAAGYNHITKIFQFTKQDMPALAVNNKTQIDVLKASAVCKIQLTQASRRWGFSSSCFWSRCCFSTSRSSNVSVHFAVSLLLWCLPYRQRTFQQLILVLPDDQISRNTLTIFHQQEQLLLWSWLQYYNNSELTVYICAYDHDLP
jgi:hypothetical protein